jgi:integrase
MIPIPTLDPFASGGEEQSMARKPSRSEWHQHKGLWSRSLGYRGVRVRLFQKRSGGQFYRAVWIPERGEDRRGLATSNKAEADRLGKELLSALFRKEEVTAPEILTLGKLWERYSKECVSFLDNTPRSIREAEGHAEVLLGFFGADCDVRGLSEQDQLAFVQKRLAGGIVCDEDRTTEAVRSRSVEIDLQLLHAMLRWAVTVRRPSARRLLDQNPLAGVRRPKEKNPKRPVATWERFQATRRTVQALVDKAVTEESRRKWLKLELALVLAEATGRRLGAIRQLRWADIDLSAMTIRWRAETDKKGKEWIVPIPVHLCEELRSFRLRMGGAFGGLVFPRHSDPTQPLSRDSFGHWLRDAEAKAGLPKLDGSLWHAYRRSWATSRKSLPVVDVAAAGGWSDVSTLLNCYQQADKETLLEVMSHSWKIRDPARTG